MWSIRTRAKVLCAHSRRGSDKARQRPDLPPFTVRSPNRREMSACLSTYAYCMHSVCSMLSVLSGQSLRQRPLVLSALYMPILQPSCFRRSSIRSTPFVISGVVAAHKRNYPPPPTPLSIRPFHRVSSYRPLLRSVPSISTDMFLLRIDLRPSSRGIIHNSPIPSDLHYFLDDPTHKPGQYKTPWRLETTEYHQILLMYQVSNNSLSFSCWAWYTEIRRVWWIDGVESLDLVADCLNHQRGFPWPSDFRLDERSEGKNSPPFLQSLFHAS